MTARASQPTTKLRVYGGLTFCKDGKQHRTIVCARSQRRAVEILQQNDAPSARMTLHQFRGYWSETGNAEELKVATEEGVWRDESDWLGPPRASDYTRIK